MWRSGQAGIPNISRGDQYMCVPGCYYVSALWVHVITKEQLMAVISPDATYQLDDWDGRFEFDLEGELPPHHGQ